jgi:hypothetical protein
MECAVDSLTDDAVGCFLVTTDAGSRYWLDLDRRILRRSTVAAFQQRRVLRRDEEEIGLVAIVRCQLGRPLVLLIDLKLPGIRVTTRASTAVTRISPVPAVLVRP